MKSVANPFSITIRVYYEDTDAVGIVYYANYLKFMERCRSDWLRDLGCDVVSITRQFKMIFAVQRVNCEYFKPACLSDLLTVSAMVLKLRRASLVLEQRISRDQELLCRGEIRLATLDSTSLRPKPFPGAVLNLISSTSL